MNIVLITGANRGIGKALSGYYLAAGFIVYAGTRDLKKIPISHENLRPIKIDISNDRSIESAVNTIKSESGHINILINNAGVSARSGTANRPELVSKLTALNREKLVDMFNVNAVGALIVAKYCVPIMTVDNSFIVNISSIRATYDNSANGIGSYGYSSSKIALNMMTLCLVHELPNNISTFAVHPGSVKTDMNPNGSLDPDDSACAIANIINNWREDLNGSFLNYDGTSFN